MTNTLISFLARLVGFALTVVAFTGAIWIFYCVYQLWGCCGGHLFG